MAKKKTIKRRSSKKKGMSLFTKVLIGGAVAGGAYLIYDQFFAKKEDPQKAAADAAAAAQAAAESERAAAALNAIDPGTNVKKPPLTALLPDWMDPTKKDKRNLSPKGTIGSKQNWGIALFKNDIGGEVETLQALFNRISKAYGKKGIDVDGNFGRDTEAKRVAIIGGSPGVTLAQVYKLVTSVEASKNKNNKPTANDQLLINTGIPNIVPNWVTVKP